MLADVVRYLACPKCGAELRDVGVAIRCENGHSFDVAHQGYVNLLPGDARPGTADTPEMVAAREAFLATGGYAPIAGALADAAHALVPEAPEAPGCVVDLGAGTGYYLARVLETLPGRAGVALDISKHAARRAARAHERVGAVVCDAWARLPLRDGAATLAINVFAPRNAEEIARVLRPAGILLVVTPTPRHLRELVEPLGLVDVDARKAERLEAAFGERFEALSSAEVEREIVLTAEQLEAVVAMGPSARHTTPEATRERIAALPKPTRATLSVTLGAYRKR